MEMLTERHYEVLQYITDRIGDGVPPTVREICREMEIKSTSTAHKVLKELVAAGHITMGDGQNRAIRLAGGSGEKTLNVPLVGTVAAGLPILAVEQVEDYVPYRLPRGKGGEFFALRVKGESMIEAGILEGDIIIAQKTPTATNGQIVVALIGEEATVKTFYKEAGHFRLQPENHTMEPIITQEVLILGKVVSLMRSYD